MLSQAFSTPLYSDRRMASNRRRDSLQPPYREPRDAERHRRKPGGKAVAHPGRGKPGRPLSWLDELEEASSTSGLPLFDWADRVEIDEKDLTARDAQ